jgi:hypothetical protein
MNRGASAKEELTLTDTKIASTEAASVYAVTASGELI